MPPKKKPRRNNAFNVSSSRTSLPFTSDDPFATVHIKQSHSVSAGSYTGVATSRSVLEQVDDWLMMSTWRPLENWDLALDANDEAFQNMLEGEIHIPDEYSNSAPPLDKGKKKRMKAKSEVLKRPNVVWRKLHRASYLDEILRLEGRGDFTRTECVDCLTHKVQPAGRAEYRCASGCLLANLVCQACCVRSHKKLFLHRIEKWNGIHFVAVSLKDLGLRVQLNHTSLYCTNPVACHKNMVVIHHNGFHEVAFDYCGCSRAIPQHLQLLRRRFYPSSQLVVKTCASFELLRLTHKLTLASKCALYDVYRALEKLTDGTGLNKIRFKFPTLMRMLLQWRHLMMMKWAGRGHDPDGVDSTTPGQLAVSCPSCPIIGVNLPNNWHDAPEPLKFLYTAFICMDANFRLKNQLTSNYSQDPGLGIGLAYMVPREGYEAYVLHRANESDVSSCVGFQAIAQANTRFSQGLRYTGVGGVFCGRSEMVMPMGVGNLQKGERFANMDYIFGASIRHLLGLAAILISYDIACQWFTNLHTRMTSLWPESIRIPSNSRVKFIPAIPKLHEPMHNAVNHQQYSLNFMPGVGMSDFECPERVWSAHNPLGNATKNQGPGSRQDVIDDHFNFWNWLKVVGMGRTLMRKYLAAVSDRNIQTEAHRGLSNSLDVKVVERWKKLCTDWEEADYPKTNVVNPYVYEGIATSEEEVRKEMSKEELKDLATGQIPIHQTSPSAFISMGLDIEDTQLRVRKLAKETSPSAAGLEGGLDEQRAHLRMRIKGWEILHPVYLPGLLQFHTNNSKDADMVDTEEHPEDQKLSFPSTIPADVRPKICHPSVILAEERLRTHRCYDALDSMRHGLKIRSRLVHYAHYNIRGQREGTRSRAVISRVVDRVMAAATKYRHSCSAKFELAGTGSWEADLRILEPGDIRGYSDTSKKKSQGRLGTLEDHQVAMQSGKEVDSDNENDIGNEESVEMEDTSQKKRKHVSSGQTRRELSWIWVVRREEGAEKEEGDEILQVEWAKSRARSKRAEEEVLLLREEMRRVLEFFRWKAQWWTSQGTRREATNSTISRSLAEGLQAHASKQSEMFGGLEVSFRKLWLTPLSEVVVDDENDSDVDDDDDDEDGDDNETTNVEA